MIAPLNNVCAEVHRRQIVIVSRKLENCKQFECNSKLIRPNSVDLLYSREGENKFSLMFMVTFLYLLYLLYSVFILLYFFIFFRVFTGSIKLDGDAIGMLQFHCIKWVPQELIYTVCYLRGQRNDQRFRGG